VTLGVIIAGGTLADAIVAEMDVRRGGREDTAP
jgi:hypothetical protein